MKGRNMDIRLLKKAFRTRRKEKNHIESYKFESPEMFQCLGGHKKVEMLETEMNALKMQIPLKVKNKKGTNRADCPVCGSTVRGINKPYGTWCSWCGQKLFFDNPEYDSRVHKKRRFFL